MFTIKERKRLDALERKYDEGKLLTTKQAVERLSLRGKKARYESDAMKQLARALVEGVDVVAVLSEAREALKATTPLPSTPQKAG